jgi:hypothetical protein
LPYLLAAYLGFAEPQNSQPRWIIDWFQAYARPIGAGEPGRTPVRKAGGVEGKADN